MEIFFQDPSEIPLPPDKVRIRELHAEPFSDNRRVRIRLEITPFLQRPNCEIHVLDENGNQVASLSIIESIDPKMDFTIHLRIKEPTGRFTIKSDIYYYENEKTKDDPKSHEDEEIHHLPSKVKIVDSQQTFFVIGE